MTPKKRHYFDTHLEFVLAEMPAMVHRFLDDVPLLVEDYPSAKVMDEMEIEYRDDLCGLHSGIPLTKRSIDQSGVPSDVVLIYREGILSAAADDQGDVSESELRRQIRITILHEFGHHVGLSEEELEAMGYG